jgi:hypothetical protein
MNNIINQLEKNKIDVLCNQYGIQNYIINADGTIDVHEDVILLNQKLAFIPLQFNKVSGSFNCSYNKITSLVGCPVEVSGNFICSGNYLTSLEHCPVTVGSSFYCYDNNISSLVYFPTNLGGAFICHTTKLPHELIDLSFSDFEVFYKYMNYYDVWRPKFNINGFNELLAEIRDGLL